MQTEAGLRRCEQLTPKYLIDALTAPLPEKQTLASTLQTNRSDREAAKHRDTHAPAHSGSKTTGNPQDRTLG